MAITRDAIPSGIESGYVDKPFDQAKAELEEAGYKIITLKQFGDLRIAQGKDSFVSKSGAYTREGVLYIPNKGIFLVRNSPIMANAKEATNCHRNGKEFYLTAKQVEESLGKEGIDSVRFANAEAIPTNRFDEDVRTVFAFGSSAKAYGNFLKEVGIAEMPVYLTNIDEKPFARQAWLHRFGGDDRSGLYGDGRVLDYDLRVRGVFESAEGTAKNSEAYAPDKIQKALQELGFSGVSKGLLEKLRNLQ